MTHVQITTAAAGLLIAAAAAAEEHCQYDGALRVEVSDDGQEVATRSLDQTPGDARDGAGGGAARGGGIAGASSAIYGTAPDWQNTLRRQVGGLQVADMNNDMLPDLVVGCYISQSFPPYDDWHNLIYFNIGGELEAQPTWISDDEVSTGDVQVADINGDGFLDIFSANGGFAMSPSVIYFGSLIGPSTTPGWISAEPDLAWNNYALPFDVDHDGDIDVVTANQGNSEFDPFRPMYLFRNTGGVLETAPSWQSAETSIQNFLAFGDLDDDGWEDLAVSKWANFESGVYRNEMGELQVTPIWTTGNDDTDKGVAWSDVDGNGEPDLALGHDPTQLFSNVDGLLSPTWSASGSTYFGHSEIRFADVDGDGDDDLAEIHFGNGHVRIYVNENGSLSSTPSWQWDAPSVGTAIAFGDINGDEKLDLVVGTSGEPCLFVFYNQLKPCLADVSGDDGVVGPADLATLLANWGPCAECGDCPGELTGNCNVEPADLAELLANWGDCP